MASISDDAAPASQHLFCRDLDATARPRLGTAHFHPLSARRLRGGGSSSTWQQAAETAATAVESHLAAPCSAWRTGARRETEAASGGGGVCVYPLSLWGRAGWCFHSGSPRGGGGGEMTSTGSWMRHVCKQGNVPFLRLLLPPSLPARAGVPTGPGLHHPPACCRIVVLCMYFQVAPRPRPRGAVVVVVPFCALSIPLPMPSTSTAALSRIAASAWSRATPTCPVRPHNAWPPIRAASPLWANRCRHPQGSAVVRLSRWVSSQSMHCSPPSSGRLSSLPSAYIAWHPSPSLDPEAVVAALFLFVNWSLPWLSCFKHHLPRLGCPSTPPLRGPRQRYRLCSRCCLVPLQEIPYPVVIVCFPPPLLDNGPDLVVTSPDLPPHTHRSALSPLLSPSRVGYPILERAYLHTQDAISLSSPASAPFPVLHKSHRP